MSHALTRPLGWLGGMSQSWAETELASASATLSTGLWTHPVSEDRKRELEARFRSIFRAVAQSGGDVSDEVVGQIRSLKRDIWWHQPLSSGLGAATRGNAILLGGGVTVLGVAFLGWRFWRRR